jgi:hypothetical protein
MECPNAAQIFANALPLLPRGDAWQSNEPPGQVFTESWVQGGFMQSGMMQELTRPPSVMHAFFSSVASVFGFVTGRLCDLEQEFFCATASETLDLWFQEYGLPDGCDPFPNLCAKVAAFGGTDCAFFESIAGSAGWSISCAPLLAGLCGQFGASRFGEIGFGGEGGVATIGVTVDLENSPAFQGLSQAQPFFGALQFGNTLNCPPDITGLSCLLDRVVHAEIVVIYETV